jgi:hypothetical protein
MELSVATIRQAVERLGARAAPFRFDQLREELQIAPDNKQAGARIHNVITRWTKDGAVEVVSTDRGAKPVLQNQGYGEASFRRGSQPQEAATSR